MSETTPPVNTPLRQRPVRAAVGASILAVFTCALFVLMRAEAAGVSLSLSDGSGRLDGGPGGITEITATWTTSGFYATGTQIVISISPAASSTIADCSTPDTEFITAGDGAFGSFSDERAVYTLTQNAATGTSGSLCLQFELTDATSTDYLISMRASSSTSAFTTSDVGAALYDVLGGNEVTVTADVPSSLSFSMRNAADAASTNACSLGTLSLTSVNYCAYRLRIATNAANGFTTTIEPSGPFTSGSDTISAIANDTAFATGTEAYGMAFFIGATSGGRSGADNFDLPATEAGAATDASLTFDADATPLNFTSATTILSFTNPFNALAAPSPTTTSLVVHGAAIGAGTAYGSYTQTITYRVTGSY